MSKITPGPWVKEYVENLDAFCVNAQGDDGHPVEICFTLNNEFDVTAIAALPDLIEAAEPIVRDYIVPDDWPDDANTGRMLTVGQFHALRSALLKAKGGAA